MEWRKLKDGRCKAYARYRDPRRKRRVEVVGALPPEPKKGERQRLRLKAQVLEAQRKAEVENGEWLDPDGDNRPLTFTDLAELFLRDYRTRSGKMDYTRRRVEGLQAYFGNLPLAQMTFQDVERYRDATIGSKGGNGRQIGPSTVRKNMILLSMMFRWAMARGEFDRNPADPVAAKRPAEPKTRPRYISPAQQDTILSRCEPWLRWPAIMAFNTGMDLGEISQLERHDLELERELIWAQRGKNGEVIRPIPFNDEIRMVLRMVAWTRQEDGGGRVFVTENGAPLNTDRAYRGLRRAFIAADVDARAPWKSARKTFATRLRERGARRELVRILMGHAGDMTDIYTSASLAELGAAMALLDQPVTGILPTQQPTRPPAGIDAPAKVLTRLH